METQVLFFLFIFAILIGVWANAWGRSGIAWAIAACFLSPLIIAVVLLLSGKTVEKKAAELAALTSMINNK